MLEISKMIKSLTDTESELKRIIQATQVHERGIYIDYKIKVIDNNIIELYISYDYHNENDKFINGLFELINETFKYCEVSEDNDIITKVFSKYIFE